MGLEISPVLAETELGSAHEITESVRRQLLQVAWYYTYFKQSLLNLPQVQLCA